MATKTVNTRIQLNRRNKEEWTGFTPLAGELCFELDTKRFKFGNGSTLYENLPYAGGVLSTGTSAPTSATTGELGQFYINTTDNSVYQLVAIADGENTWKKLVFSDDKIAEAVLADAAKKLQTAHTIGLTGDATGSASFDGSADASISVTLADSGVTANTYTKVTVDKKGRVTAGASLAAEDLPTVGTAGTYYKVKTDNYGRVSEGQTTLSSTEIDIDGSNNLSTRLTADETAIEALEETVGDSTGGLVKAVTDLSNNKLDKVTQANKIYATDSHGDQTTIDIATIGEIDDVYAGGVSVVVDRIAQLGTMAKETATDYSTKTVADTLYAAKSLESTVSTHMSNTSNPHSVTKAQVGLGNVDNTSDADKPISTATQAALDDKADVATTLAGYGIEDAYTKDEVDGKIAGTYHYRGSVATISALPTTGQSEGDVYNVETGGKINPDTEFETIISNGDNVAWVAAKDSKVGHWDKLAGTVDLSNYYTKSEANAAFAGKTTTEAHIANNDIHVTASDKTTWSGKQDALTTAQMAAANSGITAELRAGYDSHLADDDIHVTPQEKADWDAKQEALTTAQINAVNSGITTDKVSKYDGYEATIAAKVADVKLNNVSIVDSTTKVASFTLGTMAQEEKTNYVPTSRTINSKALSSNITLGTDDVAEGTTNKYYTDARVEVKVRTMASTALTDTAHILYDTDVLILDGGDASSQNI